MKPTQTMMQCGAMLTSTAPDDTMRILTICSDVLAEAKIGLALQRKRTFENIGQVIAVNFNPSDEKFKEVMALVEDILGIK